MNEPSLFAKWVKVCPLSNESIMVIGQVPDEDVELIESCRLMAWVNGDQQRFTFLPIDMTIVYELPSMKDETSNRRLPFSWLTPAGQVRSKVDLGERRGFTRQVISIPDSLEQFYLYTRKR